jgi:hypothetical protein
MISRPGRLATALAMAVLLVIAPGRWAAAEGPAPVTATEDRFRLTGRVGLQVLGYQEEFGDIESEYTSVGPALGVAGSLRLTERVRVGGEYLGAFLPEEEERWDDRRLVVTEQTNDLKVGFHVLDVDIGYALVRTPQVEWRVVGGWHYYVQDFTRSRFRRGDAIQSLGPVNEEVRGQGAKLGTALEGRLGERLGMTAQVAGYYLYRVDVDNARLGAFESEGVALRGGAGVEYLLTPRLALGVGWDGHFIAVDRTHNARGILPENRTVAHTVSGRVTLRF